jgi:hypothetical protein
MTRDQAVRCYMALELIRCQRVRQHFKARMGRDVRLGDTLSPADQAAADSPPITPQELRAIMIRLATDPPPFPWPSSFIEQAEQRAADYFAAKGSCHAENPN